MRAAVLVLMLFASAGCNQRSSKMATTDKWVRFHCHSKSTGKPVFMVEMPGKPQLALDSLYRRLTHFGAVDAYEYHCGDDGVFMAFAAESPEESPEESSEENPVELRTEPFDAAETQAIGREMATRMDAELTECKSFLYEGKHPAFDLAGAQKTGNAGNFRIRMINYNQRLIMLIVLGKTKVVREPEVSYFFDSLLLYK